MKAWFGILLLLALLSAQAGTGADAAYVRCSSTSISGTVNTYAAGTTNVAQGATTLPVVFPTVVPANSLLLVIQIVGADIDTSDTASFGTIQSHIAGRFEWVRTASDSTNTSVNITTGLSRAYYYRVGTSSLSTRKWQVVFVPEYTNVSLSSTVSCPAWDGSTGGIVALTAKYLIVSDTINIISAAQKGFRGGAGRNPSEPPNTENRYVDACNRNGAPKGEGAADTGLVGGKCYAGAPANGGGGSKDVTTVSYGGAGAGAGAGAGNAKAQGGKAMPTVTSAGQQLLWLAGGGGGGSSGFYGGRGGGIVIVIADTVVVPSDANPYIVSELLLDVSGEDVSWTADGGSGTIWFHANRYTDITAQSYYGINYPPVVTFSGAVGGGALVWYDPSVSGASQVNFYVDNGNGVDAVPIATPPATC